MDWDRNRNIQNSIMDAIGLTPMVRISRLYEDVRPDICVKAEYMNPSGSLKDRTVLEIVRRAQADGQLKPGATLLEGTTGNTGIATCMAGAALGYKVIIVMPEGMSEERKKTILAYGAELVLTPGGETDVDLVLDRVSEIKKQMGDQVFEVGQFFRPGNVGAHEINTAVEIWEQTGGQIDAFVMCQGTGGTVTGTAKAFKQLNPDIKIYISEPSESPILSFGKIGQHKIQGIADGLVPEILELELIDGIILAHSDEAIETSRNLARKEGIFCGISSGLNVAAAHKLALKYPEMKRIVTVINDNGLRYLSTVLCTPDAVRKPNPREYVMSDKDKAHLAQFNFEIIE